VRQYVLTRSSFGPAWDLRANTRRLAVTRVVTAPCMAAQTERDWTWVVLLDERDPNLYSRMSLYRESAPRFVPIVRAPKEQPRDRLMLQRIAAADYQAPWRDAVGPADDTVMMTRIDDDDGFAPDALARFRAAASQVQGRAALMLPAGVWTYGNRYAVVRHPANAMHTLVTPPGDAGVVYDYSHIKVADMAPVTIVDEAWGWIWVRHGDTISGRGVPRRWGAARPMPLTRKVRETFPLDWSALARFR